MMNLNDGAIMDPSWTHFVHARSDSRVTGSVMLGGPTPIEEGHPL